MIKTLLIHWPPKAGRSDIHVAHVTFHEDTEFIGEGEFLGYAKVTLEPSDSYTIITELMVKGNRRREGIGNALLKECERISVNEFNRPEAYLWAEIGSMEEAWYKRKGYIFHGVYTDESEEGQNNNWLKKQLV